MKNKNKKIKNMDDVMRYLLSEEDYEEQDVTPKKEQEEKEEAQISNRTKMYFERSDSRTRDEERRRRLLQAIARVEELNSRPEDPEIEEFFAEAKARTDAIMKEQDDFRSKYKVFKSEAKVKKSKRASETSVKKELHSEELKKMWNNSNEGR